MKRWSVPLVATCFAAVLFVRPIAAIAEVFKPASNATYVIDLDTGNGNFSSWQLNDLTGLNSLRATFSIPRTGDDSTWAPFSRFWLGNDKEGIIFEVTALKPGGPFAMSLTRRDDVKVVSQEAFLTFLNPNEAADLEVDWTPAGQVTVRLKSTQSLALSSTGETHTMTMNSGPTWLKVTGGTSELNVNPLRLGVTTP